MVLKCVRLRLSAPMFFDDRVAAYTNMDRAAPDASIAIACWRTLAEILWMEVQMTAQHLPPRPKPVPNAPECAPSPHRGQLGAAALREARHGPRYRRRPLAGDRLSFTSIKYVAVVMRADEAKTAFSRSHSGGRA
jgi:hypothetical protein